MRRALLLTLAMIIATPALAGPPIDGPDHPRSRPPDPPPLLTEASTLKTWEEKHAWEERGTFIGLLSGAAVGAGGVVALFTMMPRDESVPPSPPEAEAVLIGAAALYAGALGAYAGGFLGAGVGMVIDAAQ